MPQSRVDAGKCGRVAYLRVSNRRCRVSFFNLKKKLNMSESLAFSSDRDQSSSDSEAHRFGPAARMELAQDGADVEFGGVLRDRQASGNFFVAQADAYQAQDLRFT